jgi:hypothetical protein
MKHEALALPKEASVKARLALVVAGMLGFAVLGGQYAQAAIEPDGTNLPALAAYITEQVQAAPSLAATIAGKYTAKFPADAAVIATAAVNAAPNQSQDIVDAVLAALPDDMKDDPVLTGALTELAREGGHPAFNPSSLGAPLIATWTDPRGRGVVFNNSNNPPNSSPR